VIAPGFGLDGTIVGLDLGRELAAEVERRRPSLALTPGISRDRR
jgi:hypothetical protein